MRVDGLRAPEQHHVWRELLFAPRGSLETQREGASPALANEVRACGDLSLAKTQSLRWTVADREARLDGKCPSYSLCWALCALRSGPAPTSFLRTWRYDSNSPCSAAARSDLGSDDSIASSGCGSRSGGRGGAKRSMSFSRRPSFAGTGRASAPSGTGSPDAVEPVDRRSLARLQSSSAPWPSPFPSGVIVLNEGHLRRKRNRCVSR